MRVPVLVGNPSIARHPVSRWVSLLVVATLAACATRRGDPPQCKGAFTPINPTSVVAHDSQR
jgi:hypothetical protein